MSVEIATEPDASRLVAYEQRTSLLMVVLALVYVIVFAIQVLWISADDTVSTTLVVVSNVIWAVFVVDLATRIYLAPRRMQFIVRNPVDVIAVVLPAFRSLRVLRVFTAGQWLVRRGANLAVGRLAFATILAVTFVTILGSLAVLDAERDAPGANISSLGQALWWSVVTMSTVGYGDTYPITFDGRIVAVGMMIVGVSILGVVSATLAATFLTRIRGVEEAQTAHALAEVQALRRELRQAGLIQAEEAAPHREQR